VTFVYVIFIYIVEKTVLKQCTIWSSVTVYV